MFPGKAAMGAQDAFEAFGDDLRRGRPKRLAWKGRAGVAGQTFE